MKTIDNGIAIYEKKDIEKFITDSKSKKIFVYDKEFNSYDYITNIYTDKEGDLIIEIGGDA